MSDRSLKSTSGNRANCSSHLRIFWLSILPRMSFMILSLMSARVCILSGAICCALSCSCCFMSAYVPFKRPCCVHHSQCPCCRQRPLRLHHSRCPCCRQRPLRLHHSRCPCCHQRPLHDHASGSLCLKAMAPDRSSGPQRTVPVCSVVAMW